MDIGFGDAITPPPVETDYPTLLDMPAPRLRTYPRETVVAEKFEAMVKLGLANTRMKDFYDVWLLAQEMSFDGAILSAAIAATFERRNTELWPGKKSGPLSARLRTRCGSSGFDRRREP